MANRWSRHSNWIHFWIKYDVIYTGRQYENNILLETRSH